MKKLQYNISKTQVFFFILVLITIGISLQSYLQSGVAFKGVENKYTHYNNFLIFKQSFFHLIHGKDLYQLYLSEHWDLFKYSPTFALLIVPFALLPDDIGLVFWNLLNAVILFTAFWKLPFKSNKFRTWAIAFILIESITSLQNSQSNCLIAGLIILAFLSLEKGRVGIASLLIVLTVFIKPFGLVAFALFILYPNKLKAVFYSLTWVSFLGLLPLIVISPSQLIYLYKSWYGLLVNDHAVFDGLSVMGWLHTWFGIQISNSIIVFIGSIVFCLPLFRYKQFSNQLFRLYFLASILIWVVIFNHKAESPTFIIAIAGAAIWFFTENFKIENLTLLLIALIFTILSPTDIFPKNMRNEVVVPYVLKAVPCILIWFKLIYDQITLNCAYNDYSDTNT
jgi:hypothetical protein